eukprot:5906697-Prymnesium_polylepis.2
MNVSYRPRLTRHSLSVSAPPHVSRPIDARRHHRRSRAFVAAGRVASTSLTRRSFSCRSTSTSTGRSSSSGAASAAHAPHAAHAARSAHAAHAARRARHAARTTSCCSGALWGLWCLMRHVAP